MTKTLPHITKYIQMLSENLSFFKWEDEKSKLNKTRGYSEDRTEKARFLEEKGVHLLPFCSSDMTEVAKCSVPWFIHMWKIPQSLQDFKDYYGKAIAVCTAWIKRIRITSKPLTFSKHPKHNDCCTGDFQFDNKESGFHQ